MRYSTIVEKDDKTLLEIIAVLEQFEQSRFIAGIQARHYTKYDIELLGSLCGKSEWK